MHRIGRTARGNTYGTAVSLFTVEDAKLARPLIRILEEAGQEVDGQLRDYAHMPDQSSGARSRRGRQYRTWQI